MDMGGFPAPNVGFPIVMTSYASLPTTGISATTGAIFICAVPSRSKNFNMSSVCWSSFVATTTNTANYWQVDISSVQGAISKLLISADTRSDVNDLWQAHENLINLPLGQNSSILRVDLTKVGSPGTINILPPVIYGWPIG